ncbi:hypothetical protein GCM10028807_49530 [Spirosoma daeguense]
MATGNPRVWFKSISLENIRSFGTNQKVDFTGKDGKIAQWNVILGDNGTGKTTVLKALAVITGRATNSDIIPMVRNNGERPSIRGIIDTGEKSFDLFSNINLQAFKNVGLFVSSSYLAKNYNELGEQFVLCAYGAARRIGPPENVQDQTNTVVSLFNETAHLTSAESWLLEAELNYLKGNNSKDYYELVKRSLLKLFRGEVEEIKSKGYNSSATVFFETQYGDVMMRELSLGYKTLIAWIVDFAKTLFSYYSNSENPLAEPAVCLVDEIDLHLHPKFQRTIIQFLTDTFPNTQFIVTAHSPLIVQSAEDANIILLKREGDETHVADGIDVHSWRIDQILSSDLFGGIGGRSPDVEEKMKRRRALLRQNEMTVEEKAEFNALEKELGNLPVSESREALKALDIISQALIKQ